MNVQKGKIRRSVLFAVKSKPRPTGTRLEVPGAFHLALASIALVLVIEIHLINNKNEMSQSVASAK